MFLSPSFLLLYCLLSSDMHCFWSGQLMWLLQGPGSWPGHWDLLCILLADAFLRHALGKLLPSQQSSLLHYFPENEMTKSIAQVIFRDICVIILLHMASVLAKWYHSFFQHILIFLFSCLSSWVWNDI